MEPPADSQGRRRRVSADRVTFKGEDADGPRSMTDGGTDDELDPWKVRLDGKDDWQDTRRQERRRERERRWEQLQLST